MLYTGIRRCGKSSLLKLIVQYLKSTGKTVDQIIEMNFESHDFKNMSSEEVYGYVKEKIVNGKRMYLFFDEILRVDTWEDAINSFRVDFDCDIYNRLKCLSFIIGILNISFRQMC